jgi:peptidoglycan/xylan/chitin deacetylase (PgdA/CDA1 family)
MRERGRGLRGFLPGCVALGALLYGCDDSGGPGRQVGAGGSTPISIAGWTGSGGLAGPGGTSSGSGTGGTSGAATAEAGGKSSGSGGSVAGGSGGSSGTTSGGSGGSGGTSNNGAGGSVAGGGGGGVPACPTSLFAWPNGAEAAVSLTYDDTLASQLDNALPALNEQGLKMTFFLITQNLGSAELRARYAAALNVGHELGSHSVTHPCDTASYTLATMGSSELEPSIATLRSLGAAEPFTYAYPCGTNTVGASQSYIPEVTARFSAGRGVSGIIADPKTVDLSNTPGVFPPETDTTGATAIGYVTQARSQGGWAIFGFHGVGGDYSIYPKTGHDALAQYLGANKAKVWTATFRDVAAYVAKCR